MTLKKYTKLMKNAKLKAKLNYNGKELQKESSQELINSIWARHTKANSYMNRYFGLSKQEKKSLNTNLEFEFTYIIELKIRNEWSEDKINDLVQNYNHFMNGSEVFGDYYRESEVNLDLENRFEIINVVQNT